MSEYEQAKAAVVEALIAFLVAGEQAGTGELELTGEFMAAFQQAAGLHEAAVSATADVG